uniref:WxxW domain-containing protein n=1 Tax=Sinocyclocheilus rhinocerous TaxID=307959 RepID=A0A673HNW3_9TELE
VIELFGVGWFDRDDPNGNGDYELLADLLNTYPGEICPNPIAIEAQTVSSQPASQTANIFQVYNPTSGFACVKANQVRRKCADYKVRFTCPEEWTCWFDRDDPIYCLYHFTLCNQTSLKIFGFACVNAQQIRRCQDYKVRFTCPMRDECCIAYLTMSFVMRDPLKSMLKPSVKF